MCSQETPVAFRLTWSAGASLLATAAELAAAQQSSGLVLNQQQQEQAAMQPVTDWGFQLIQRTFGFSSLIDIKQ